MKLSSKRRRAKRFHGSVRSVPGVWSVGRRDDPESKRRLRLPCSGRVNDRDELANPPLNGSIVGRTEMGGTRGDDRWSTALLFALTFVINLVGSLAYSVRIAGYGRYESRCLCPSSTFFSLFPGQRIRSRPRFWRSAWNHPSRYRQGRRQTIFDRLLAAASLATIVGAVLTPTCQRLFTRAVKKFARIGR